MELLIVKNWKVVNKYCYYCLKGGLIMLCNRLLCDRRPNEYVFKKVVNYPLTI